MLKYSLLLIFIFFNLQAFEHKPFAIITASYNNATWYKQNLDSVFCQEYDNWRMIYIDDCSCDGTGQAVQEYIKQCKQEYRVTFIQNDKRQRHLANQYAAIHACANREIIVILDGDDWLAHNHVLEYVNNVYQDQNVWLTYGQFREFNNNSIGYCRQVQASMIENNNIRQHPWVFGHLRTFYAGLFKLIKEEDLKYNGAFFSMAADVATMIPMAEMAGNRIRFIEDVLYIHNDTNPLCLQKAWPMQTFLKQVIRNRPKYTRVVNLD